MPYNWGLAGIIFAGGAGLAALLAFRRPSGRRLGRFIWGMLLVVIVAGCSLRVDPTPPSPVTVEVGEETVSFRNWGGAGNYVTLRRGDVIKMHELWGKSTIVVLETRSGQSFSTGRDPALEERMARALGLVRRPNNSIYWDYEAQGSP